MKPEYLSAIQSAQTVILNNPECIEYIEDQSGVRWSYSSASMVKSRKELRKILNDLWGSGAYNYEQFAKSLRVDTTTIQALIDEEFVSKHNL